METLIALGFNMKKRTIILILISLLIFSGCITKNVSQKGYIFDEDDISQISVGLTNKENTLRYLGYPLNKSYFDDNIWIYYSYQMKEVLFFKPKISNQKLLVLEFDKETDIIKNLSLYNINSNNYEILNDTTNINDEKQSIIQDILKNIGQFSM